MRRAVYDRVRFSTPQRHTPTIWKSSAPPPPPGLYSPRFKCQQGKEGNIPYIPFFTKAYGSLRVKQEGNIASGYFVIFITHRVRVCAENLRTSVAYCAFCNNGAQIGLRSLYCDVIITPKARCLQCIENFVKHWMLRAECWFDDVFATFHARKPCAV